ncbi:hypothetical protein E2C01_075350 [Portunus trituberculatus]|uniref:Uncharacterized protein n=1 Tax=Portunus trituberculatus TaxID=210409 RepID=A0A5B7IFX2_PORTR|nr:hypothetical protein [Portunus trituberculatus]
MAGGVVGRGGTQRAVGFGWLAGWLAEFDWEDRWSVEGGKESVGHPALESGGTVTISSK